MIIISGAPLITVNTKELCCFHNKTSVLTILNEIFKHILLCSETEALSNAYKTVKFNQSNEIALVYPKRLKLISSV